MLIRYAQLNDKTEWFRLDRHLPEAGFEEKIRNKQGDVLTEGEEAYTSHNTTRLDVDGVVKKIMTTDYVKEELEGRPHIVEA